MTDRQEPEEIPAPKEVAVEELPQPSIENETITKSQDNKIFLNASEQKGTQASSLPALSLEDKQAGTNKKLDESPARNIRGALAGEIEAGKTYFDKDLSKSQNAEQRSAKSIARDIEKLESDSPEERQKATENLERSGRQALGQLQEAMEKTRNPETYKRLSDIVEKIKASPKEESGESATGSEISDGSTKTKLMQNDAAHASKDAVPEEASSKLEGKQRAEQLDKLVQGLGSEDPDTVEKSRQKLQEEFGAEAIAKLTEARDKSNNPLLCREAGNLLEKMLSPKNAKELEGIKNDPEKRSQRAKELQDILALPDKLVPEKFRSALFAELAQLNSVKK